jgi:PPP family 3-phenylpropionic acid transporter
MLFFSFFCNAIMPQFEAITLDTLGERRADYGRLRVWGSVGFILVTLGYGWLIERYGSSVLPALMLPLFLATAISAFANRMPAIEHHDDSPHDGTLSVLRRPGVAAFLCVAMLMQIGFGPYYVFFTLYLGQNGHGTDTIGVLWALGVLAEIGLFLLAPRLLRRYGPLSLLLLCLGVTALRWLMTALYPQSLALMLALQLLHALSFGIFHACCMQLMTYYFPGRLTAQGQALLYAISSGIGGVLGAGLAGLAWELGGGLAAFSFAAVASAAGFALALKLRLPATATPVSDAPRMASES